MRSNERLLNILQAGLSASARTSRGRAASKDRGRLRVVLAFRRQVVHFGSVVILSLRSLIRVVQLAVDTARQRWKLGQSFQPGATPRRATSTD